jgi:hypothetical protein
MVPLIHMVSEKAVPLSYLFDLDISLAWTLLSWTLLS